MLVVKLLVMVAVALSARAAVHRRHPDDVPPAGDAHRAASAELTAAHWYNEARAAIEARLNYHPPAGNKHARNVVMFLGDGMSVPTLAAARTLLGQRAGGTGEEAHLAFETFPSTGLAKTYCVNAQIPDSACTATAYLCGVKSNQGTLGVTAQVPRYDCAASTDTTQHVASIAEWALADGRDAGLVTTTRVTHASPSGVFAKVANRHWENDNEVKIAGFNTDQCPDITHQLVHHAPGNQLKTGIPAETVVTELGLSVPVHIDTLIRWVTGKLEYLNNVILGGGRREFISVNDIDDEGSPGLRTDGRNLINEWQNAKAAQNATYRYIWNRSEVTELLSSTSLPDYILGLFENNHLQYNLEANNATEPTLAELTELAIRSLSRNEKGFFLFVEGGRIDHAHHDNLVEQALDETIEMSRAVARAAQLLSEDDSLIVVTADHAHVMAFNGYSPRGHDILGPSRDRDSNGVPYMTLSYTNGPGFRAHINGTRPDVTSEDNYRAREWLSHVDVPLESETHGGDDVAVFAVGPHHSMFTGLYEQSQLPHLMAYAACIGPGLHACSAAHSLAEPLTLPLTLALVLALSLRRF